MISKNLDLSKNLYKDFSPSSMSMNKNYLSNTYGTRRLYYNDLIKEEKTKKKNTKLAKISAFLGTSIALLATAGLIINNRYKPLNSPQDASKKLSFIDKITNISGNFMNIKDDLWDKFANKTSKNPVFSWIKKSGDFITKMYKKAIKKTLRGKYDKLYEEYLKNGGDSTLVQNFDAWFEKLDINMQSLISGGKRVSDGIFKKGFFNKFINTHMANNKIKEIYSTEKFLPNTEVCKANPSLEKLKQEQQNILNVLIPKLRDINFGSAPTDILTILASAIGLTSAVVHTDSKEDKKSVLINLGIPLIASLGVALFGTLRCLSGATSLLFGLAVGNFASQGARLTDNFVLSHKKTPD